MDAVENQLLAISQIPQNSGHPLHKGTPREAFIKEFLEGHLPSTLAIGTGEIIDANSQPGQPRNQYDIVVYKKSFPKLDFGGGISGFLIESVIATIEVKSKLGKTEFTDAAKAAYAAKSYVPNIVTSFSSGYIPPKILNYIVAYDGPANMSTVHGWISPVYSASGIPFTPLPTNDAQRTKTPADAIDAVFVLGKGFIYYDNIPIGFSNTPQRQANPSLKWIYSDTTGGNLLMLFMLIQTSTANMQGRWLNAGPYLTSFALPNLSWGT